MTQCETCCFYNYDEEYDEYICDVDLDEDEMVRFLSGRGDCPYWRPGDEYRTAGVNKHKYGWIFPPPYGTMAPTPQMRSRGRIEEMEKLCDLLGIRPGITALIGGGGKTTLMYHLARELRQYGTVAVTTTTRIWPPTASPWHGSRTPPGRSWTGKVWYAWVCPRLRESWCPLPSRVGCLATIPWWRRSAPPETLQGHREI